MVPRSAVSHQSKKSRSGIHHTLSSPSSSTGTKITSLALEGGVGGRGGTCWLWSTVLALRRQDPAVDDAGRGHQHRIDAEVEGQGVPRVQG
jgi:hypothetical protein